MTVMDPNVVVALKPEVATALQQNTEQLGAYLVQMAQLLQATQRRLDQLEENTRCRTLSHDEVLGVMKQIRQRAREYCEKYELMDPKDLRTISAAIKRAVLTRYRVKDLHDCPQIALGAIGSQVDRWSDIRLVMKIRERTGA